MASAAQVAANRENAKRSTGPRTPAGKAKSSRNALRHGFFSECLLLPEEDPQELGDLREAFFLDLCPQGPLEELLVETIVAASWRLRRALDVESANMRYHNRPTFGVGYFKQSLPDATLEGFTTLLLNHGMERLVHYQQSCERQLQRALKQLLMLRKARSAAPAEGRGTGAGEAPATSPPPSPTCILHTLTSRADRAAARKHARAAAAALAAEEAAPAEPEAPEKPPYHERADAVPAEPEPPIRDYRGADPSEIPDEIALAFAQGVALAAEAMAAPPPTGAAEDRDASARGGPPGSETGPPLALPPNPPRPKPKAKEHKWPPGFEPL